MARVSACLIVRNEKKFLDDCLSSLKPWVEEICVLDTGSTDDTVDIALSHGAVVNHFTWCDDFSAARNASLKMAKEPWILVIDSDEQLADSSGLALEMATANDNAIAWLVYQDNLDASGRTHPIVVPRLFCNRPEIHFKGQVHESIMESLFNLGVTELGVSGVHLLHFGYLPDVLAENDKYARNLEILNRQAKQDPSDLFVAYKQAMTTKQSGNVEQGQRAFERAFELAGNLSQELRKEYPFVPLVYVGHAGGLLQKGRLKRTGEVLSQGLTDFPDNIDLLYQCGQWAYCLGDYKTADARFRACLRDTATIPLYMSDPALKGTLPLSELVQIALEQGDLESALESLKQCRAIDPDNLTARCLAVRMMFAAREIVLASQELKQLVDSASFSTEVQLLAGEVGWVQGDPQLARDLWEVATLGDTGRDILSNRAANLAVAWLTVADLCDGRFDEAVGRLDTLVARDLQTAGCRLLAAVITDQELKIDTAFNAATVLEYASLWAEELVSRKQTQGLAVFASNASKYTECFPGIDSILKQA
ncbi:MAG: glycosyltransferase [Proteobacteria bacterium]|nr:glycosyltransferase [Pseudomonadota bacterium]